MIRMHPKPPLRKYEQARVLGGGSSINGQMANRGAPTTTMNGNSRCSWMELGECAPFFKKLETDVDIATTGMATMAP
ncbi:MAG: hypothetical protein CM15mP62_24410 [Rhodospirillaceae bacterium]|nr:MAG: hypothetical protein CM15mP62_24410 [Rhodospirillaceae bacterium]